MSVPMRGLLGFVSAAISVLVFHQGMWALLHAFGLMPPPYPVGPVPPYSVPRILDLCFWGGLYGIVFGLLLPRLTRSGPLWLWGLGLGVLAALIGMFIVAPLKGHPIASSLTPLAIIRSLLINGFWGVGVGLILPLLMPRRLARMS